MEVKFSFIGFDVETPDLMREGDVEQEVNQYGTTAVVRALSKFTLRMVFTFETTDREKALSEACDLVWRFTDKYKPAVVRKAFIVDGPDDLVYSMVGLSANDIDVMPAYEALAHIRQQLEGLNSTEA